jgi:aarF domain-containing kinase
MCVVQVTTDVVALLDQCAARFVELQQHSAYVDPRALPCFHFIVQVTTDVVALLDEWAARFFDELDYVKEGQNATLFAQQMAADLPQVRTPNACNIRL